MRAVCCWGLGLVLSGCAGKQAVGPADLDRAWVPPESETYSVTVLGSLSGSDEVNAALYTEIDGEQGADASLVIFGDGRWVWTAGGEESGERQVATGTVGEDGELQDLPPAFFSSGRAFWTVGSASLSVNGEPVPE